MKDKPSHPIYDDETIAAMEGITKLLEEARANGTEDAFRIQLKQACARANAIDYLHKARIELGQAGYHDMAREVASLTNLVKKAEPNGNPVA